MNKETIKKIIAVIDNPPTQKAKKCSWCGGHGQVNKFIKNPHYPTDKEDVWDGVKDCPYCNGNKVVRERSDTAMVNVIIAIVKSELEKEKETIRDYEAILNLHGINAGQLPQNK